MIEMVKIHTQVRKKKNLVNTNKRAEERNNYTSHIALVHSRYAIHSMVHNKKITKILLYKSQN